MRRLADQYADWEYRRFSPNEIAAGALDAEMRATLQKEVLPEYVEIELQRIKKMARGG
jgi:hypothetical protein